MKKNIVIGLAILACIVGPSASRADVFDFGGTEVEVEYWGGAGSSASSLAMVVIDFGGSAYFAFGYGWNAGTPSTRTALMGIDSAGALNVTFQQQGANYSLNTATYGAYSAGGSLITGLWQQYLSTDGENWGSPTSLFTNERNLTDGAWDGFALRGLAGTDTPTAPIVPEPGTLALLAVGLGVVAARRRRSRAEIA